MVVNKMNVGAGQTKGIRWPGEMTVQNRAQVPISITGELAHAGIGLVKATPPLRSPLLGGPIGERLAASHGTGFIKQSAKSAK